MARHGQAEETLREFQLRKRAMEITLMLPDDTVDAETVLSYATDMLRVWMQRPGRCAVLTLVASSEVPE